MRNETFTMGLTPEARAALVRISERETVTLAEAGRRAFVAYDASSAPTWETRIKIVRERVGLSQGALAEELGVSRTTISNMEQGRFAVTEAVRAWIVAHEPSIKAEAGAA